MAARMAITGDAPTYERVDTRPPMSRDEFEAARAEREAARSPRPSSPVVRPADVAAAREAILERREAGTRRVGSPTLPIIASSSSSSHPTGMTTTGVADAVVTDAVVSAFGDVTASMNDAVAAAFNGTIASVGDTVAAAEAAAMAAKQEAEQMEAEAAAAAAEAAEAAAAAAAVEAARRRAARDYQAERISVATQSAEGGVPAPAEVDDALLKAARAAAVEEAEREAARWAEDDLREAEREEEERRIADEASRKAEAFARARREAEAKARAAAKADAEKKAAEVAKAAAELKAAAVAAEAAAAAASASRSRLDAEARAVAEADSASMYAEARAMAADQDEGNLLGDGSSLEDALLFNSEAAERAAAMRAMAEQHSAQPLTTPVDAPPSLMHRFSADTLAHLKALAEAEGDDGVFEAAVDFGDEEEEEDEEGIEARRPMTAKTESGSSQYEEPLSQYNPLQRYYSERLTEGSDDSPGFGGPAGLNIPDDMQLRRLRIDRPESKTPVEPLKAGKLSAASIGGDGSSSAGSIPPPPPSLLSPPPQLDPPPPPPTRVVSEAVSLAEVGAIAASGPSAPPPTPHTCGGQSSSSVTFSSTPHLTPAPPPPSAVRQRSGSSLRYGRSISPPTHTGLPATSVPTAPAPAARGLTPQPPPPTPVSASTPGPPGPPPPTPAAQAPSTSEPSAHASAAAAHLRRVEEDEEEGGSSAAANAVMAANRKAVSTFAAGLEKRFDWNREEGGGSEDDGSGSGSRSGSPKPPDTRETIPGFGAPPVDTSYGSSARLASGLWTAQEMLEKQRTSIYDDTPAGARGHESARQSSSLTAGVDSSKGAYASVEAYHRSAVRQAVLSAAALPNEAWQLEYSMEVHGLIDERVRMQKMVLIEQKVCGRARALSLSPPHTPLFPCFFR